jgi:hypothetical protein
MLQAVPVPVPLPRLPSTFSAQTDIYSSLIFFLPFCGKLKEKTKGEKKMKKLTVLVSMLILVLALTGCNKQMVDLTYSYERAILSLPNGEVIEGKVSSWTDFEDGDQIQVRIDGKTYLVHSSNIVLISD